MLGIFVNSSTKDAVANVNRAKAYLKVGKSVDFSSDFNGPLPAVSRSLPAIEAAQASINQVGDKLKHAMFWFAKESPIDEIALGHFGVGNTTKAKEILDRKSSYSSKLNRAVVALIERNVNAALPNYDSIFSDTKLRENFLNAVCGSKVKFSEQELSHMLIDGLLELFSPAELLSPLKVFNLEYYKYAHALVVAEPLNFINSQIAIAKNAPNNPDAQYDAAKSLMDSTKQPLQDLKKYIGDDDQYQILADALAKQILQCSINYYNDSKEPNRARKAYPLQQYALEIAVGESLRKRCQENFDIIKKHAEALPPENLENVARILNKKISDFEAKGKKSTIDEAITFIKGCVPYLCIIKEEQGINGKYYRRISTEIEEAALNATISRVNAAMNLVKIGGDIYIREAKETLKKAWEITAYMSQLDIEASAKERFDSQSNALRDILSRAGLSTMRPLVYLNLQTESEMFNVCRYKRDYKNYLSRYPNGKYVAQARAKIAALERQEEEERRNMINKINVAPNFASAISLYKACSHAGLLPLLDARCFELCKTKADYIKYLNVFGKDAKHHAEARKITRMARLKDSIFSYVKKHRAWFIAIAALIFLVAAVGLVMGIGALSLVLRLIACISIGCAVVSFFAVVGGNLKYSILVLVLGLFSGCIFCITDDLDKIADDLDKIAKDNAAYEHAIEESTIVAYEDFLRDFPQSPHRAAAIEGYYHLAEKTSPAELQRFANRFDFTDLGKKAKNRIPEICDSLYQIANKENTIEGWNKYLAAVPYDYYYDSKEKIKYLENEPWNTDEKAWNQATTLNNESAYRKYLELYPKGKHRSAANKKLIDYEVDDVFASSHGDLPSMDQTGYGNGPTSYVSVYNNTSYILTLLYSGPSSERLVIPSHQTKSVTLRNGTYRIAASVTAAGIGSFAGSETLSGGSYSVEYYIVTSRY